jgi:hypothetical protein
MAARKREFTLRREGCLGNVLRLVGGPTQPRSGMGRILQNLA